VGGSGGPPECVMIHIRNMFYFFMLHKMMCPLFGVIRYRVKCNGPVLQTCLEFLHNSTKNRNQILESL
jgi:hypothetical protein